MILAPALAIAGFLVLRGRAFAAAVIGGPILGIACYLSLGIALARERGLSRFYGAPLTGEQITNSNLLICDAAIWSLGAALLLFLAGRILGGRSEHRGSRARIGCP
jgi:hypothetical protein